MTKEAYIKNILKKIQCGRDKKKDIQKQLETDIHMRLEEGEAFADIAREMGSVKEIADSFNEELSEKDRKQYRRGRTLKIILLVVICLAVICAILYWVLPKAVPLEDSRYFDQAALEEAMTKTIDLFDKEDYDSLKNMSTPDMQPVLTKETMDSAKAQVAQNWGSRVSMGQIYGAELIQTGKHFGVGEVTVTYENASVTFHLTYNEDMQLAGLYIR